MKKVAAIFVFLIIAISCPFPVFAQTDAPTPTPTDSPTPTDTPTPTPTASDSCINVPPAPVLTSVVSNSNNTATLTWADVADPVSNYLASYGTQSGKYIYGAPNIGGQGTTSFTIGSLSGNKTYYFVVAATNKCGISSFSSEVSAVVNPVPSTPESTIGPTLPPDTSAAAVVDTPTEAPTDTPSSNPQTYQNTTTFRDLGIGVIVAGVLLIGSVVFFQIMLKKKNQIPPIHGDNLPQQPTIPMEGTPPQPPTPPTINNSPPPGTF